MNDEHTLGLIRAACAGDEEAATELVASIQDRVYGLALRMLAAPPDAEDATQEILLRIMTKLATFRGDASFSTWVHRIAVNHLLNARARSVPERNLSFEAFGAQIDSGVAAFTREDEPVDQLLSREVRLSCTHAMLVCLSRPERIAFLLGAILQFDAPEAADILEITPATFRKRLSRARERIKEFMSARCGIYDARQPCRCEKQAPLAIQSGRLNPDKLQFARLPVLRDSTSGDEARELTNLLDVVSVLCTQPTYQAPGGIADHIRKILAGSG